VAQTTPKVALLARSRDHAPARALVHRLQAAMLPRRGRGGERFGRRCRRRSDAGAVAELGFAIEEL